MYFPLEMACIKKLLLTSSHVDKELSKSTMANTHADYIDPN